MMTNILEYLEKTVSWLPQKRAFWDAGEEITFSRLYQEARAVGYHLYRRGIRREPVAVFMGRRPSAVAAMLGAVYAGCWFVPLDAEMTASQIGQAACELYQLFTRKPHRALRFERNVRFFIEYLVDAGRLEMTCRRGFTFYQRPQQD